MQGRWFILFLVAVPLAFGLQPAVAHHDPAQIPDMVERVKAGVVSISAKKPAKPKEQVKIPRVPKGSPFEEFFDDFFDKQKEKSGKTPRGKQKNKPRNTTTRGSGFIIHASGLIATAAYVIKDADEIFITLSDGAKLKVEKVMGTDSRSAIALLKVKPDKPLKALEFGDSSSLRVGEQVIVIGNPFSLGHSVSSGIVSALNRDINSGPYDAFIQTDAAINKGHAGGPLFNLKGEVIGMNTAMFSPSGKSVGIGFAIPANTIRPILDQLKKFGEVRRGWLGLTIQTVPDEMAEPLGMKTAHGALVTKVTPNSSAEKAGIKPGDVIVEFNGIKIDNMRQLPRVIAATPPGKRTTVVIFRNDKRKTLSVVLGLLPKASASAKGGTGKSGTPTGPTPVVTGAIKMLGLTLGKLTPELRSHFKIGKDIDGVVITEVDTASDAARKNISAGDVIVEVRGFKVKSPEEVQFLVDATKKSGRNLVMLLIAGGKGAMRFVALPIGKLERFRSA